MGSVVVYPVVIHKDERSDYGVSVPDLPGCVSAGSSLSLAFAGAREAIYCHAEGLLIDGDRLPEPSAGEDVDLDGGTLAYVDVDIDKLSTESERVNVTLPKWLIAMIDSVAGNRSKFLAESAMKALEAERRKTV
jgi:predicted RNase H-like HicB family nuclease